MQENLTNEGDRLREAARALIEECRRKHDERIMSEATIATYGRFAGQAMFTPGGKSIFRRGEVKRKEAKENTGVYTQQVEIPGFPGLRVRFIKGAPYYIS